MKFKISSFPTTEQLDNLLIIFLLKDLVGV